MRSQKTSSGRPKKNASATAVRNARKCAGQSGQNQTSACKIDKKCGGCQFQKLPYKEQLKRKQKQEEQEQKQLWKERKRQEAILKIRERYGKNALLKGMNLEEGATTRERNQQIGGHKA